MARRGTDRADAAILRRLARVVGYPFFFPASVFIGLELVVRLALPQVLPRDAPEIYVPDASIGWRHRAGAHTRVNTGERDVEICIDARENRASCTAPPPESCRGRVLVIGDSFVEALALPFADTAWWQLQADTGACVESAGVGAYEPGQYLALARERLRAEPGRFQVVILSLYWGNDFTDDAERVPPARDVWRRPVRLLPAGLSRQDLEDWAYPLNQWLEWRSHAYVALRFALRRFMDPGDAGIYGVPDALRRSRMTERVLAESARSVSLIAQEARAAGARLIVTFVPIRNQVTDPSGEKLRAGLPAYADDLDMELVGREFVPRLRAIPDIELVDLLPVLRASPAAELWEPRDGHFSAEGHRLWFEALRGPVRRGLGLDAADSVSSSEPGAAASERATAALSGRRPPAGSRRHRRPDRPGAGRDRSRREARRRRRPGHPRR